MFNLRCETPKEWVDVVLNDFDSFLLDHAACERKASANAVSFTVRYPNHPKLVQTMVRVAQEEMEHYAQMTNIIYKRGLRFGKDEKDPYINALIKLNRWEGEERLIDRLLIFSIVEGRGCERFHLLANALPHGEVQELYADLVRSESQHHIVGVQLLKEMFPKEQWEARYQELLDLEGEIVRNLPLRAALH